jgi:hypothetical protein
MMTKEAWKSDLIMATWNVRTMLIPGKMQDVVADLKVIKITQWIEKTKEREREREREQ